MSIICQQNWKKKKTISHIIFRQRLIIVLSAYARAETLYFFKKVVTNMFCNMNQSIREIKNSFGTSSLDIFTKIFHTVLDIRWFSELSLNISNTKFFFGGFLAYKMVKLTPGYASLSFEKSFSFSTGCNHSKYSPFCWICCRVWIHGGKLYTEFSLLYHYINQLLVFCSKVAKSKIVY